MDSAKVIKHLHQFELDSLKYINSLFHNAQCLGDLIRAMPFLMQIKIYLSPDFDTNLS